VERAFPARSVSAIDSFYEPVPPARTRSAAFVSNMSARDLINSQQTPNIRLQPIPALTTVRRFSCFPGGVHIRNVGVHEMIQRDLLAQLDAANNESEVRRRLAAGNTCLPCVSHARRLFDGIGGFALEAEKESS
jgi:hypothetical protein